MATHSSTLVYDFECRDCWDVFFGYTFNYSLLESDVLSDKGIAYASIACPSCGGGDIEIQVPVPQNWDTQIEERK
jgi:hypothetical protein